MSVHGEHIKQLLSEESNNIVENEILLNQFDDFNNGAEIVEPFSEDYYTLKQWIAKINAPQPLEPLVMPLTYLTIIDKDHNLLVSGKGQFNFDDKTILNDDITIFLSNKDPRYDSVNDGIKFYPESQSV